MSQRTSTQAFKSLVLILSIYLLSVSERVASAHELPATSNLAPVAAPHFPDTAHAVVWRNWSLVSAERLAHVLSTSPENVIAMAESMGLPADLALESEMQELGYITILRRNWHLLPYPQLLELLDISAEELALRLREDDFLYIKLGSLKPDCPTVVYQAPSSETRKQADRIRQVVRQYFGNRLDKPAESRFAFVNQIDSLPVSDADEHDHSNDGLRMIYSYYGMFGDSLSNLKQPPYPEALLAQLQSHGVNAVWLHTVLSQLAPGGEHFPMLGEGHENRLENLRQLVARAERHNIKVYLYINEPRAMPNAFFADRPELAGVREGDYTALCTSTPQVRQWLHDSMAHVFREVPGLGGVFTITASENLTNCASHGGHQNCPHCKDRTAAEILAEVNRVIASGVKQAAPEAKIIAYDWAWGDAREVVEQLPDSISLMCVSEWALPIERGGVATAVGEYSISAVGPGPRAKLHWGYAKEHGLSTIAKVQLNNSWELSSVPYLPVLDLVGQHCERLYAEGVDGMMLSWSLGGYPSLNLELAQRISDQQKPDAERALQELAEKHFGVDSAPHVRAAWRKFSQAFVEYPYSAAVLYKAPQHLGPANLLYGQPTGYTSTMVGIPYDDLQSWRGPYPSDVFIDQFQKVASGWADGIAELEAAERVAKKEFAPVVAEHLRVATAAQLHFESVVNQSRFVLARDALQAATDEAEQVRLREKVHHLLTQEIELARRLYDLASIDSRLGYEASNHYFYVPLDLVEKVVNCEDLQETLGLSALESNTP